MVLEVFQFRVGMKTNQPLLWYDVMVIWFVIRSNSAVAHQLEGQLFDAQVCELDREYEWELVSDWVRNILSPLWEIKQVKERYKSPDHLCKQKMMNISET